MYTRRIVGIHIYTYTYRHGRQTRLQVVVVTRTYWRQQSFHDMFRTYILYIPTSIIVILLPIIHGTCRIKSLNIGTSSRSYNYYHHRLYALIEGSTVKQLYNNV